MSASAGRTIVVGGGGFGRELISQVMDCNDAGTLPALGGYLDDNGDVLAPLGYDIPWLGTVRDFRPSDGDLFTIALGSPSSKRTVAQILKERGGRFARMIHPSSVPSRRARLGEGIILCTNSSSGVDTSIGDFVTINGYTGLGHDATIGEFTTVSSHVDITGYARIGADVFIGSGAILMPKVRIGDGASVGAGSVVYRSVPAGATVYATPAKRLK